MWIHVPSIPFPSVPGTEELSLDSEQLSQLESSVMWKSNFQQQKSWQNVWKKRLSMRRLSGLLLKPSTLNRGVEKWICSLEGSLASPSASPGRSLEKMIQETSGPTQPDLLGGLGFQSSFLKMCPESSDTTGKPYDPNYERWVTKLRRDSSQRPRLGPLTRGNDSLSWRTRAASDPEGGIEDWSTQRFQNIDTPQIKLRDQAANWPTPNAGPQNDGDTNWKERRKRIKEQRKNGNGFGMTLGMAATSWENSRNSHQDREIQDGDGSLNTTQNSHRHSVKCMRLNPRFVTWMMLGKSRTGWLH